MKIFYFAGMDLYKKPNPSFHLVTTMLQDALSEGHEIYYIGVKLRNLSKHIPEDLLSNPSFHYSLIELSDVQKNRFILRYLNGVWYAFKSIFYIRSFIKKSDVCFLQSTPTMFYNVLATRLFSNRRKIIINIQDMFPGSSIASGVMRQKWMQNFFYAMQRITYKKADIIVAISSDMKNKLIEQGVPTEKLKVILNWFDDKTVSEVEWDNNRFVNKYNLSARNFYVQYAGTFGYVFDYKMVLKVAQLLKGYPDIKIQMIGTGSQRDLFVSEACAQNLENIQFYPLESQDMVSDVYSTCNVCYIPLKEGVIGNSVPSKVGLLMQCKRAIVTSVDGDSDYANEINKEKIGYAYSCDDPQSIADAILFLYKNRDECIQMGIRGYKYGHVLYSRRSNMQLYMNLFESCISL